MLNMMHTIYALSVFCDTCWHTKDLLTISPWKFCFCVFVYELFSCKERLPVSQSNTSRLK